MAMLVAHALDTLGHPILAYYFWQKSSSTSDSKTPTSIWNRFSWSILFSTFALSRFWSALHTWHNTNGMQFSLFYFGYDVYTIMDRQASLIWFWMPAYLMEGLVYAVLVMGKLWYGYYASKKSSHSATRPTSLDRVPSTLLRSNVSESND